ncbi:hypothetical protein VOLCADRAFT_105793 [Volvox carteri f. nagariensis]|uniref:Uncharacterized protein n=1 Tax=Volvox carteri f. nagariensis TaxID=3068 RepID=D8U349_VOLCA|nr:uncharacterized protein VOLCADRAFT_105793 [Volvox carteri f. nagariensis]EFJ46015.1 hypothetical protein VOLCADRAFT_105793 [Volvox carteri f. nagariensis]|eukprot:XP_002953093.1 hypothetical protein VOLCADRAFT_105793 [Volvox carteri f. nagariensis]
MCQIKFDFNCKAGFGIKYNSILFTLLTLAVAASTVFLGGLASLQNECHDDGVYAGNTNLLTGVTGFSATTLTCKKIYRFYWFIVSFEYVIAAIGLYAVLVEGKLSCLKGSVMGLFVIGTLLFIYTSNSFLNILEVNLFQSETLRDRSKTAVAGAIITATLNALTVFAAGYQE